MWRHHHLNKRLKINVWLKIRTIRQKQPIYHSLFWNNSIKHPLCDDSQNKLNFF